MKAETLRKIAPVPDPAHLAADLEMLRGKALAAGASEASIIGAASVAIDAEVMKRVQGSPAASTGSTGYASYHWPLSYPKDPVEEAVAAFQKAVFFRVAAAGSAPERLGGPISDRAERDLYYKVYEITAAVESASFYYGHHLAVGFAVGNCRAVFCADEPACQAMKRGQGCLHPYKARPSLEAVGIDARELGRKTGWNIIPDDGEAFLAGLVLVY